jgi:hypothetical protein
MTRSKWLLWHCGRTNPEYTTPTCLRPTAHLQPRPERSAGTGLNPATWWKRFGGGARLHKKCYSPTCASIEARQSPTSLAAQVGPPELPEV